MAVIQDTYLLSGTYWHCTRTQLLLSPPYSTVSCCRCYGRRVVSRVLLLLQSVATEQAPIIPLERKVSRNQKTLPKLKAL